jgi:hypothetical protein
MLVRIGASVRRPGNSCSTLKPRLNIDVRLGLRDLAGALDRLWPTILDKPDQDALRATGTDEVAGSATDITAARTPDGSGANGRDKVWPPGPSNNDDPISFTVPSPGDSTKIKRRRAVGRGVQRQYPVYEPNLRPA